MTVTKAAGTFGTQPVEMVVSKNAEANEVTAIMPTLGIPLRLWLIGYHPACETSIRGSTTGRLAIGGRLAIRERLHGMIARLEKRFLFQRGSNPSRLLSRF